jgi:hypothetical protein
MIILLLYAAKPKSLELSSLMRLLDRRNYPCSRRRLGEELDYLRSNRLLRLFPVTESADLSDVEQAKLIQRYVECDSDEEMGQVLAARITTSGIDFQEDSSIKPGIARVE